MKMNTGKKLVAPDGGWGWAIALAYTIFCFLVFSSIAAYGLIFKSEFQKLNFSGTQSSLIFSSNGGFSMLCGLVNGTLLNKYGTRTVGVWAAILIIIGLIMTAFSTTFFEFFLWYGVIAALGMGMGVSAYTVAINTYFDKRRNKVTGYAFSLYGSGTILFPQLVSYLLYTYTTKDTMLLIAAIAANTLVSSMLLQPVRRHMKVQEIEIELNEKETEGSEGDTLILEPKQEKRILNPISDDLATIYASMNSLNIKLEGEKAISQNPLNNQPKSRGIIDYFVKIFDLSLLTDSVFVTILIGLGIEFIVEFNYLWLIPFLLIENDLSVEQAATFMSIYAIADISFRFFSPYIASWLKQSNRVMYMVSLVLVVLARTCLIVMKEYIPLLFVGTAIGAFRGMRLVYWSLVIPEYLPPERLASAFGVSFTFNGICMFIGAPILGQLRDASGNYKSCVLFLNAISVTTVIMWSVQIIYSKMRDGDKRNEKIDVIDT